MAIRVVRLGNPRTPGEGLRVGTVRRPPRDGAILGPVAFDCAGANVRSAQAQGTPGPTTEDAGLGWRLAPPEAGSDVGGRRSYRRRAG